MKKILTLFLTAILSVFIVGCDKDSKESTGANTTADNNSWPNKNITIIVPFYAGGDTDFHARNLASHLEKELGVTIIVNNVSGPNGNAGMRQMVNAKPDGYTALFFHESMLTNKVVGTSNQAHDALSPVAATIVDDSYVIAVNAKSNMKNLDDLVAEAKKKTWRADLCIFCRRVFILFR
ncbi:tripartite tricarboxylate transporter substrate-binding protein [Testudinibacter sp. P27/CKL/0425]